MLTKSKSLLKVKSLVRRYCPELLILTSRLASRTVFYQRERKYLRSVKKSEILGGNSLLFFAPERCASQYMNKVINQVSVDAGYQFLDIPNYHFHSGDHRVKLDDGKWVTRNLNQTNTFYGSLDLFRTHADVSLSQYKLLATVRDPRDVLVSSFYSIAYAHAPSSKRFAREAREAREKGIEWFVTQEWRLEKIREKYRFINRIKNYEYCYFWRYEDMMDEFESFLMNLSSFIAPDHVNEQLISELVAKHKQALPQKSTNDSLLSHIRSGKNKQYLTELNCTSISFLEQYFHSELENYGYVS